MDQMVAGLVLFSALLHPMWNAMIKRQERADGAFIGFVTVLLTLSFIHATVQGYDLLAVGQIWPLIAISVVGQLLYGSSLIITLRRGDLSSYYPIVRSSPLFIVIIGVLFLDQSYSWAVLAGVACVLVGAFALQYRRGTHLLDDPKTLMFALLAMMGTGIYSLADSRAVQIVEPPVVFFWVEVFNLIGYLTLFRYFGVPQTRFADLFQWTKNPLLYISLGCIGYTSYILILTAYNLGGDVAAVTAVRQASIPFSVLLGGLMFREGSMVRRFFASCLLAFGIIIIAVMG